MLLLDRNRIDWAIPAPSFDHHRRRAHRLRAAAVRLARRRLRDAGRRAWGALANALCRAAAFFNLGETPCHSSP